MSNLSVPSPDEADNRKGSDRRGNDRRRSAQGLFEIRARRERVEQDRRQTERRVGAARWLFWRR